ncbi:hypothetical protein V6N12_042552 [Hibiscus sabdariffa]|uniref:Uncharacterized protein n=1 Tax=Hibiscus sabdariffa TaxID=183260 RepID=A0ABR2EGN7_9ROSI
MQISIFCPLYKHKLRIVDNEEFYEQEKPSCLKNLRYLTVILRQASQQLLRMISSVHHSFGNWFPTTLLVLHLHLILEDKDSLEWEDIVMIKDEDDNILIGEVGNGIGELGKTKMERKITRAKGRLLSDYDGENILKKEAMGFEDNRANYANF